MLWSFAKFTSEEQVCRTVHTHTQHSSSSALVRITDVKAYYLFITFCDVLYWWITWDGLVLRPRISSTSRSIHTFRINYDLEEARLKNPFEMSAVYNFSILSTRWFKYDRD